MDKFGYILKQDKKEKPIKMRYHKTDLLQMTTFQLQEICRKEKIIQGIINPMDKEELIHVILRYRGAEESFLIQKNRKSGIEKLEKLLKNTVLQEKKEQLFQCSSKIIVYEGLAIGYSDGITLPYKKYLVGTNAFVVGGDKTLCAILNVVSIGSHTDFLYLLKKEEMPCQESKVKNYTLYCMEHRESDLLYQIYNGMTVSIPEAIEVYRIPLFDFEVRKPIPLSMPIAIDFGTSNTSAGVYLEHSYFEKARLDHNTLEWKENEVNYTLFYDINGKESVFLPSVVGLLSVEEGKPEFLFGYDAIRLADSSYIDEGFCIFYDIKRWIMDYEKQEEIIDRQGRRGFLSRKEILKAYFEYVIRAVRNQFKCEIYEVYISCSIKQKIRFQQLIREILPDYRIEEKDMIEEGAAIFYYTISEIMQKHRIRNGEEQKALLIDCGGGMMDLCSCRFRVWDKRVAYQVELETTYENGSTNFGGNTFTYRIMQFLKILVRNQLCHFAFRSKEEILSAYNKDVFRYVDQYGTEGLYQKLEEAYQEAEQYLPTRFQDFESQSRADYYKVKNNFYLLFRLAETVKKAFSLHTGILQVILSSQPVKEQAALWIPVDKWKLSVCIKNRFTAVKEFPTIALSIYELEQLLQADIYGIMSQWMEKLGQTNRLEEYSVIKLTGQSCRMAIFREVLKEYIPGRLIQFRRQKEEVADPFERKVDCIEGALRYLKDKRYGFADIQIQTEEPALPYQVTAYTHNGEEVNLISLLKRNQKSGMISRNMENLTLKLYLKDGEGKEQYQYTCFSSLEDFEKVTYEQIQEQYQSHILQMDTDDIVEKEVRFFVWAIPVEWSFLVVPVYRKEDFLYLGIEKKFYFEKEEWINNYFDGRK